MMTVLFGGLVLMLAAVAGTYLAMPWISPAAANRTAVDVAQPVARPRSFMEMGTNTEKEVKPDVSASAVTLRRKYVHEAARNFTVVELGAFLRQIGFDVGTSRMTKEVLVKLILLLDPTIEDVATFKAARMKR